MPEAFAIYETLPMVAQQEILDFIYFIAAKTKQKSRINDDYDDNISERMAILESLEKFRGRLPKDFDADKELAEAKEEKYLR